MKALMDINVWANRCGYYFNAYLTPFDPDDKEFYPGKEPSPNNGYNCRHPDCDSVEDGVGCCYAWACPLGYEADEEDCADFGVEYEAGEYIVVDMPKKEYDEGEEHGAEV